MAGLVHSKIVVGGSEITSRRCCPNSPSLALSTYCLLTASFGRKVTYDLGRSSYAAVGGLVMCRLRSNRCLISRRYSRADKRCRRGRKCWATGP
jgi:hypothetical protein